MNKLPLGTHVRSIAINNPFFPLGTKGIIVGYAGDKYWVRLDFWEKITVSPTDFEVVKK